MRDCRPVRARGSTRQAGVVLNLTPDHLERHGDMASYGAAKCRLFARMGPGDLAVVDSTSELLLELRDACGTRAARATLVRGGA